MEELLYTPAVSLARAIRHREISSEELVNAQLQRILAVNGALNSVIQIAGESALRQAREADLALARGDRVGRLHGVPFSVKDVYSVGDCALLHPAPGMAPPQATAASPASTVVRRLRSEGAILLAVTKATLWSDREERYGFTHNPYDLKRTPGGSSGGEAALIAAGGSPLGFGSDSGGSLRQPAHYCGLATLRPSNGRVPRAHDADGSNDPRTVAGPLARSVEDVALALRIIAGFDWEDPSTLPLSQCDETAVVLRGLRVAVHADNGLVSPTLETAKAVLAAAHILEEAGARVEPALPADLEEAWTITQEYWRYCGEEGEIKTYFAFLRRWDHYRLRMHRFMEAYDLLLCPVEACPAPLMDAADTPVLFTYTTPFSLVGWPSGVVRAGTSPENLPIGVQLVGAPWRDDLVLAAARAVEVGMGEWPRPRI